MAEIATNINHTYYAIMTVSESSQSTSGNYTDLYYEVMLYNGNQSFSGYTIGYDVYIDGTQVAYHDNSGNQTSMSAYSSKLVVSGTTRVYHSSDGTKNNMPMSVRIFTNNLSYLPVELNGSGTTNLTPIPRYANFTEHYVQSTGLNSITVHWNADASCDWVQYSLNGGGWVDTGGLTYTIGGLSPNTQYSIRTKIRRTDSGLWTESGYIYGTTKDIGKVTSAPNINLGDNPTINITNPSGEQIKYFVEILNPTETVLKRTAVAGNNTITFTDEELDKIYKKMGTGNSTTLRFGVETKLDYWHWLDKTCTLTGNQKTIYKKILNNWKRGKVFYKVNGSWKRAVIFNKTITGWKRGC